MPKVERYMEVSTSPSHHYDKSFPSRFPWIVKQNVFTPFVDYIRYKPICTGRFHHYVDDVMDLKNIFDKRYVPGSGHYSFAFALAEYEHMMHMFTTLYHFYEDEEIRMRANLLAEGLATEIKDTLNGGCYRPCSCGSCIISGSEYDERLRFTKKRYLSLLTENI